MPKFEIDLLIGRDDGGVVVEEVRKIEAPDIRAAIAMAEKLFGELKAVAYKADQARLRKDGVVLWSQNF